MSNKVTRRDVGGKPAATGVSALSARSTDHSVFTSTLLEQVGNAQPPESQIICLLLVHNENHILPDFFRFYRALGNIQFIVVDDRSDDGTAAYLSTQNDVLVFRPKEGSTYSAHKREWRAELLDHFANGAWALVPDADERLMWRDFETRPFQSLIADLEAEGAQAFYCTMVDMYKDGPLSGQVYSGVEPLEVEFPFYDDPLKDPVSHRFLAAPRRFVKRWPTPPMIMYGGMRDRVFLGTQDRQFPWARIVFAALPTIRNVQPKGAARLLEYGLRLILKRRDTGMPALNLTKVPLVKWRAGLRFYGGAHAISEVVRLSRETGVLLHFPITKGEFGVRYTAERGQHAEGGAYYQTILDRENPEGRTFSYSGSSRFARSGDLSAFLRSGQRE
jgi:hypothetical protein